MDEVRSALIHAIREGDLHETTRLIRSHGRHFFSEGYDLLLIALENNHSAIAKLILTKGFSVRRRIGKNIFGGPRPTDTPLHLAVRNGDLEIVRLLLNKGAMRNEKNQADETPIGIAVQMGFLRILELLLNQTTFVGVTKYLDLLHIALSKTFACKEYFEEIVKLLLKKLADVLASDKFLLTPLHVATIHGSDDVVNFLLERGEPVDVKDEHGETNLHYAAARGDLTVVQAVLKHRPDITDPANQMCLKFAVRRGGKDCVKIVLALLDYGFTISPENAKDSEFFHGAVEKGIYSMVSDLLENGADANAVFGRASECQQLVFQFFSPLHMAVKNRHERVAELLINNKADVNAQGENRIPPIFYSVVNEDLTMTELLLNNGAALHYTILNDFRDPGTQDVMKKWREFRPQNDFISDWEKGQLNVRNVDVLFQRSQSVGLTTLHISVMKGSEQMVELLLRFNANVNVSDERGVNPLHISAELGNLEISTLLLDNGATVNAMEIDGNTPLHLAATGGHSEVVELLLERGAQVNPEGPGCKTPLLLAAERDDCLKCSANASSTDRGSVELNTLRSESSDTSTETPDSSLQASRKGSESLIDVLLKYNANVNSADKDGVTSLHIAAQKGNFELCTLLLAKGADVDAKERKKNETPLHHAVTAGHKEIITLLLESGADVNSKCHCGKTPVHWAAERDDSSKDSVNASSIDGLSASIKKGSEPIIYVLLRHNANVNLADKEGKTLLHISVKKRNLELCTLLLDMGAEVNAENQNGDTALHLAIAPENDKIVRLLLERGAHVNHKGMNNRSPLHWAAWKNLTEIIEVLLEFGAEVDSRCVEGKTALHYCSSSTLGPKKSLATLIEYGADSNITCKRRKTPLDYATHVMLMVHGSYLPCGETVLYLKQHQVKMEVAGLVDAGFWPSVCEREGGLEDFHSECQLELTRTKSEFIEDSNVSYYDIVRKDTRCVAKYMKNPSVMLAAESEDYRKTFPLFASIIKGRFRKGLKSVKLLESTPQVMRRLTGLPDVCIEEILDHLSVGDLKVLMEV